MDSGQHCLMVVIVPGRPNRAVRRPLSRSELEVRLSGRDGQPVWALQREKRGRDPDGHTSPG